MQYAYLPIQKVITTDYQDIARSQKQISNRRLENVGKEELKKGRLDEALCAIAFQM